VLEPAEVLGSLLPHADGQLGGVSTVPHDNVGGYREVPLDDLQKELLSSGHGFDNLHGSLRERGIWGDRVSSTDTRCDPFMAAESDLGGALIWTKNDWVLTQSPREKKMDGD